MPRWADRFGPQGFIELIHHAPCRAKMFRDDGKFFREVEANIWDPLVRLRECDKSGVSIQVLSTVPVMFNYATKAAQGLEIAQFLNDHLASVVALHPERFLGLATLPMQVPELAAQELVRAMRELGLCGAQIGSHVNAWNLGDPELFAVYEQAEKLGAALFVHPWDMMGEGRMPKYFLPWLVGMPAETSLAICSMIFGGVFERFPKLRVAFAHGGGAFPGTFGRIEHGFHARPDLCAKDNPKPPSAYLGRFYVDSLVHDMRTLRGICDLFGKSKVMLGSDYPFPLGEGKPGALIESMNDLDVQSREALLSRNALEWLGRSRST